MNPKQIKDLPAQKKRVIFVRYNIERQASFGLR